MLRTSRLAASVKPSATLVAGAKARELAAAGIEVYDFSLGEPDFRTPEHIIAAAHNAMLGGQTHYTPSSGTAEIKAAIAGWYKSRHGFSCGPENIIVSNGAKHSLHNALAALVGPGDDVVIPSPYWVSYSDLVEMAGARPVLVLTTMPARFRMTAEQLRAALTPATRAVMLNSPCNPTGAVYPRNELEAIVDVLADRPDIAIISDEIYENLVYEGVQSTCIVTLRPWLRDRTVTISGASKSYAMTGWRLGWAMAPPHVVKAMDAIQSQETSCPSSISQAAVIAALQSAESPRCVAAMRAEFAARRDIVCERLSAMPGVQFLPPDGAFYAFFDVSRHFGRMFGNVQVTDSTSFCVALLDQAHVNLVPGVAFGAEGFVRMSFACKRETIVNGMERLKAWLAG